MAPSHLALSLLSVAVPAAAAAGYTRNDQYYAAGVGEYASNYGSGGGYTRDGQYYQSGAGDYADNYGTGGGSNRVYGNGGGYEVGGVYYAGDDGMQRVYGTGGGYSLNDVYYSGDDLVTAGSNRVYGNGGGYEIDGVYYAGDDGMQRVYGNGVGYDNDGTYYAGDGYTLNGIYYMDDAAYYADDGPEECLDVDWADSSGNDCFFYMDNDLCGDLSNHEYSNQGDDADSACCECGGGILGNGNGYVIDGVYYAGSSFNNVDTGGLINGAQMPSMVVPAAAVLLYALAF